MAGSKTGDITPYGSYTIVDMGGVGSDGSLIATKKTDRAADLLPEGELVMPKDDIGGGKIIGKAAHIPMSDAYVLGDHVYGLSVQEGHPKFLAYAINSRPVNRGLLSKVVGSAQLGLGRQAVLAQRVPFPPLAEQRAISVVLSDADDLIGAIDRLIAKKRAAKNAAMNQLLLGSRRVVGIAPDVGLVKTEVGLLPADWELRSVGELAHIDPESFSPLAFRGLEFNYVSLECVSQGVLRAPIRMTAATAPSRARRALRDGDVVFGTVRPNLRSHAMISDLPGTWVGSTGFAVIRAVEGVADPRFLFQWLMSDEVLRQADRILTGSSYPALSSRQVASFQIACPQVPEQRAIGQVLTDMDDEIEALAARRDKAIAVKQALMEELLTGRTRLV